MKILDIVTKTEYELFNKSNSGQELFVCPACSSTRKKKGIKCLSWNHGENIGFCNHCSVKFGVPLQFEPQKQYVRPEYVNTTALSDKAVEWFFKRGIKQNTLNVFKVGGGEEFMPQTSKLERVIHFNYFRNDNLVNIKYRDGAKNYKLYKGAELIFYNIDAIKDNKECLICEGEIDALSWHEAGYKYVVSVPNGANKGAKLDYLDNCWQYFDNKEKIYIAADNDEAGLFLRNELSRRLGIDRCYIIDHEDCKDANEYLVKYSEGKLLSLVAKAKPFPIEGVFTINDVWDEVENIYNNGLPQGAKTGDSNFDNHLGCVGGELTVVTGIPNQGKSIYLDQVAIGLAITSNWEFAVCSPESYPISIYYTRLIKRLLGKKFSKSSIKPSELQACKIWLEKHFNLISPALGYNLDLVLERAAALVKQKGIKGLIIDPWNRIEANMPNGYNEGKWVNEQLSKIIAFNQKYGVHTFLVAHPTKIKKDKEGMNYMVPNLYDISGSANFFNMTQNGFTVYRNFATKKTEIYFQKVKWEHLGKTGRAEYVYSEENARFYLEGGDPNIPWITTEPAGTIDLFEPQDTFFTANEEPAPF